MSGRKHAGLSLHELVELTYPLVECWTAGKVADYIYHRFPLVIIRPTVN